MKYLKYFEQASAYEAYKNGSDYVLPNVSYVVETEGVSYEPYVPPAPISLCDIAYWDGSAVRTVSQSEWNSSLGTPVGVVVIPSGMLPDGKARMVGLKYATSDGTSSDSPVDLRWTDDGYYTADTSLTNYFRVPTTDNAGSTSTGSDQGGYFPSDNRTGTQSYVDPLANYRGWTPWVPSPYLGDNRTFNPEYSNSALSDFDGLGNTQILVGLTGIIKYMAPNACWNYDGGVSDTNIQWYLPAAGELGFLVCRLKAINEAITTVGGVAVPVVNDIFWSSTEYSGDDAYGVRAYSGVVSNFTKGSPGYARPFAIIN